MAIVKKYKSEVVDVANPSNDVYTVTFKASEKRFKYKPGQFLHLALDEYNPSLPWPESRCFSMQSNPDDENVKVTFSIKGAFTRRMADELIPGKIIYLKLPYGNLFSSVDYFDKCIFIAGGTGVTPFLSLFTALEFEKYINPILYFGLKNEEFDFYENELRRAATINKSFVVNKIYAETEGLLNIEKIFKLYGVDFVYYISGPPAMIKGFKKYLVNSGVAEENVITDDWE